MATTKVVSNVVSGRNNLWALSECPVFVGRGWFCLRLMKDWWRPRLRRLKLARSSWRCGGFWSTKNTGIKQLEGWVSGGRFADHWCNATMILLCEDQKDNPRHPWLTKWLVFMRTDFFFENQSCLWDYISMFSYIPLLVNILSALQSSPKIWRSEEIPKAKKEQKASADLEREQSKQVEVSQGSLLETGHGSGGNHWGLGEASQPLIALRGPSVMWSGSHQDIKDTTAALEADGAVSTEVKEFPGVFWRGGGTFFGNTIRFYYESLEDTEADDILEVRID